MLRCNYSIQVGELFTVFDDKLVISRKHRNNHLVKEGGRKFDVLEISSGLIEQSIALNNEDGVGLDNIQCNSTKLLSVTRVANVGYAFHGYEFSKCRPTPKQLIKQKLGKESSPLMTASKDGDNLFFLYSQVTRFLFFVTRLKCIVSYCRGQLLCGL
jgi:CCR4-NOT transcriptional regulation complex NOT5 subunit